MGQATTTDYAAAKDAFDEALTLLTGSIGMLIDVEEHASDVAAAETMHISACGTLLNATGASGIKIAVAALADAWCVLAIEEALHTAAIEQNRALTELGPAARTAARVAARNGGPVDVGGFRLASREDHVAAVDLCYEAAEVYVAAARASV